jgi:hypothetical protein
MTAKKLRSSLLVFMLVPWVEHKQYLFFFPRIRGGEVGEGEVGERL